jgi:addiction module RelE/StbE family toxin
MQIRFSAAAIADVEQIREYITRDNPAAAHRVAAALVAAADRLASNPRAGRIGAMDGTFELIVSPYILVYEIQRTEIVVARVWHGRQRRPGT